MPTAGPELPTTAADYYEGAWSDLPWLDPANVCADDDTYASIVAFTDTLRSTVLHASGFDLSAVPSTATIDGVECGVFCLCVGSINCDLVQLLDTGGARTGDNQCAAPVAVQAFEDPIACGGASDTWGCALTAAWVKDADFGVGVGFVSALNESELYVDYITITVYYTEASGRRGAVVSSRNPFVCRTVTGG
jgi:hypothetical protein